MKYEDLSRDGAGDVIAGKVKFPVEIGLLRPVAVAGAEIESLTLQQEPTVLDLELCRKTGSEITRMVHLLASLAELSPDEVRALKAADCAGSAEAAGAFLIADQDNSAVRRVDPEGIITSVHFAPPPANGGDEGPAAEAVFVGPLAVEVDGHGNVYVADAGDHRVRKIDSRGAITAVAGTGERGFEGDGRPARAARFDRPSSVALDGAGNVYVADASGQRIRKIDADGTVVSMGGTGASGFSGDGGPATEASLTAKDIAADKSGNIYIADGRRVRRIDAQGNSMDRIEVLPQVPAALLVRERNSNDPVDRGMLCPWKF